MTSTSRFLWSTIRDELPAFVNLSIGVVVFSAFSMLLPVFFALVADEVLARRRTDLLLPLASAVAITVVGLQFLYLLRQLSWNHLLTSFMSDQRVKVYDHVLSMTALSIRKRGVGELVHSISGDIEAAPRFIHYGVNLAGASLLRFVFAISISAAINWQVALLMVAAIPIATYINHLFASIARKHYRRFRLEYGQFLTWVHEALAGLLEIARLRAWPSMSVHYIRRWPRLLESKTRANIAAVAAERTADVVSAAVEAAFFIAVALTVIEDGLAAVGSLVALTEYFVISRQAFKDLSELQVRGQGFLVRVRRLQDLLSEPTEPVTQSTAHFLSREVTFRSVHFGHGATTRGIKDLSLHIPSGECVAIVGVSGAGKSTFVDLLLRFYEPSSGTISIGGRPSQSYTLKTIRESVAVVRQKPLFLSGTVRENFAMVAPQATEEMMLDACSAAQVASMIHSLPLGLDTPIGRGPALSEGEQQRLGLARALLRSHKILVIDEGLSAVDTGTEMAIYDTLFARAETIIIIAHRLTSVSLCDRIIVMEDGAVLEEGTHAQLVRTGVRYGQLFADELQKESG